MAVKPTLLAFHGSGSSSTIHTVQLARLNRYLKQHFDIISLEAPFPSAAGPGILPFFEGCGPYKRWVPPSEKITLEVMKSGTASRIMALEIESLIRETVSRVRSEGGKVVGAVGFSQGTRVVAGLLKGTEMKRKLGDVKELDWLDFSFGLSVCTSYPPPLIPPSALAALSSSSLSADEQSALADGKIQMPTLHVLGKQDEWVWAGKSLIEVGYEVSEGKSKVLELEMGHHYPVIPEDTEKMRDWVMDAYKEAEEGKR